MNCSCDIEVKKALPREVILLELYSPDKRKTTTTKKKKRWNVEVKKEVYNEFYYHFYFHNDFQTRVWIKEEQVKGWSKSIIIIITFDRSQTREWIMEKVEGANEGGKTGRVIPTIIFTVKIFRHENDYKCVTAPSFGNKETSQGASNFHCYQVTREGYLMSNKGTRCRVWCSNLWWNDANDDDEEEAEK